MSSAKLPPFIAFTGTRDGRIARKLGLLGNNQQLFRICSVNRFGAIIVVPSLPIIPGGPL